MGARRLHTTTSSIGTYEEEFHGGLAAPRPTCRSYDSRKTACPISTFGGIGRGPYQEDHAGALARCGSSGELLDVPTLASVEWYFCFQMWLSMHSAPVIGLYAFPRFMSIDNNGGANSNAPCVMVVSQPLRSALPRQALACKRVLVRVRERIHDPPPDYTRSRSPQAAHVDLSSRVLSPHRAPCAWRTSRCMCV